MLKLTQDSFLTARVQIACPEDQQEVLSPQLMQQLLVLCVKRLGQV